MSDLPDRPGASRPVGEGVTGEAGLPERPFGQALRAGLRDLLETILPALLLALLLSHFVAQGTVVHGQSMEPNLHTDQRVIIEKLSYHFYLPQRGDVVVLDVADSEIPLIKRVVGLPGETVEVRDNCVYVDGQVLQEPYLTATTQRDYGPVAIPAGHVFVMGDNRGNSRDSRSFGPVSLEQIVGRAWVLYWPLGDVGPVK